MEAFVNKETQKRKFDWNEVEDVVELKRLLSDKENLIVELKNEVLNLKNINCQLQENNSATNVAKGAPQLTDAEVNALRKSLGSSLLIQIVYKSSLKSTYCMSYTF